MRARSRVKGGLLALTRIRQLAAGIAQEINVQVILVVGNRDLLIEVVHKFIPKVKIIVVDQRSIRRIESNRRKLLIILFIAMMIIAAAKIYSPGSGLIYNGKVNLSGAKQNELVALNGQWEFYWNRLLTPQDFMGEYTPQMDSLVKVPGSWHDQDAGTKVYPDHGVATYRLLLTLPSTIRDPALRIQRAIAASKVYANGKLIAEVGKVSNNPAYYEGGYQSLIVDLPKDKQEIELIIQVANLNYSRGGLRDSPAFGSKQVLEQQRMILLSIQLLFIGGVLIFSIYYFLLFILQRKNKTALLFSALCLVTALHSSLWGETPLMILFPNMTITAGIYITYITSYNLVPLLMLFVLSLYPLEYNKTVLGLILFPNLFFEALLLTPIGFMASFNNYLFVLMLLQMIYILFVLTKAVLRKRDDAILMLIAFGVFVLGILADVFYNEGISRVNLSYVLLYGNFTVIIAMSYVQARQQAENHKKLILLNRNLVEADKLKDKIMATEMSFLQAQIKPHFLYNALNVIANVCEKDAKKAGRLIIDLAIYLRGSLEFNNLDKMVTIEKELEFVDKYFNIEQARFGDKIQLIKEIEIPLDYQMQVLMLEPLVENAVRHGISKKPGGGTVYIRMRYIEEGISIEVEDDGMGIKAEKLDSLLSGERKEQGVGLYNIHHRLIRLYGRGLDIISEVGHGTCVRLMLTERGKHL